MPLSHLITMSFKNDYLRRGHVFAHSIGGRIDIDDIVVLDGDGKLTLSLSKDTYESLGLTGKPSKFGRQKFVVIIDLLEKSMIPGKNGYERVQWCFENTFTQELEFYIAFVNPATSKTEEMQFPSNFKSEKVQLNTTYRTLNDIFVPDMNSLLLTSEDDKSWRRNAMEAYEWMAMASLGSPRICLIDKVDPFVSVYQPPSNSTHQNVTSVRWKGLIPPQIVVQLLDSCRQYIHTRPWISINIWGFKDSPFSWRGSEHGYLVNGENNYSIMLLPREDYVIFQQLGAYDTFS
ncbi:uncharacterized protein VTP21DRAFT_1694 [Calcarisporiella thermophila]|uniref:uncharacterized protein n=1 Tax=Calcarisporiella thermophila TaxID=911321 RepID=UPI003742E6B4